jgi:flagellum-specific ATP synthase
MIRVPKAEFLKTRCALLDDGKPSVYGVVKEVVGLVIESSGPLASIGDVCEIIPHDVLDTPSHRVLAEVVGFRGSKVLLMPMGEITGVRDGFRVRNLGSSLSAPAGSPVLGRVIDSVGTPLDGKGDIRTITQASVLNTPPPAMQRRVISEPLSLGVRSIDALMTCGIGQRLGIFAGSGVGKSTLLGMIARNTQADVNVIALVGERGREVREFIERDLGPEGLERSVVVVATSDSPALMRIKAAFTATAIAESFRDQGLKVLLMMDSVTRFAMAQREIGLAIGEPPSTKGYTPSVFAILPKLMERAGNSQFGSITAIYTILVEGDDTNEPISDTARSILDGHIVLSRKLANSSHYPAIDVMQSLSRVMPMVTAEEHMAASWKFRELISAYHEVEDLVSVGAYKPGSKPLSDRAIDLWPRMQSFLRQRVDEKTVLEDSIESLKELMNA